MKTSPNLNVIDDHSQNSRMGRMFFVSLFLHATAVSILFFLPNLSSTRTFYSPVYSVRLVSAPPLVETAREAPASAPVPARVTPPTPSPAVEKPKAKEKEKAVSLAPEKKAPEKKEDTEKKIAEAIERLRQKKETRTVESAIERLRTERESKQIESAIEGIRKRVTISSGGAVEAEGSSSGASTDVMTIKHKIYYNLIWKRIRSVWVLSDAALSGQKNLEAIIAIRIARNGQIVDIQFEKKSGNPAFDESTLRAIQKSNPLPPLPPGFEGDQFDVGVRFTPSDL
jgi:colicin import membrane protein